MSKKGQGQAPRDAMLSEGAHVVVTGERGGVGKTFTAQAVAARYLLHGVKPAIIEVDANSRLERLYKDRAKFFKIAEVDPGRIERRPELVYQTFDRAMDHAAQLKAPVIWDLGSNSAKPFFDYIAERGDDTPLGEGDRTAVVGVTNGHPDSTAAVQLAIGYARQVLPAARLAVLVNNNDPNYQVDPDAALIGKLSAACGCPAFFVERVLAPDLLAAGFDLDMPLEQIATKDKSFWQSKGFGEGPASRGVKRLARWLDDASFLDAHLGIAEAAPAPVTA